MGYSRFDSLTWSEVKVSPETSPKSTLLRLTPKKISLAQTIDFVCFIFPMFYGWRVETFNAGKLLKWCFFFGGGEAGWTWEHDWSWTCLPRKQDSDFELSLAHYRQIWGDRWGWSLNDKDAVFRYNFLDVFGCHISIHFLVCFQLEDIASRLEPWSWAMDQNR